MKYSVPLKHFSSNLHLQNMATQKNLRKTWKTSNLVSPLKIFFTQTKTNKNEKQTKHPQTFWLRVSYTALYCSSTWRDRYLEKYHWFSLDPQNITEAFTQRAHSEWEKNKALHCSLQTYPNSYWAEFTHHLDVRDVTMRSGTRLKNTKYKEVSIKTL